MTGELTDPLLLLISLRNGLGDFVNPGFNDFNSISSYIGSVTILSLSFFNLRFLSDKVYKLLIRGWYALSRFVSKLVLYCTSVLSLMLI